MQLYEYFIGVVHREVKVRLNNVQSGYWNADVHSNYLSVFQN